jgi:hypothetical protein
MNTNRVTQQARDQKLIDGFTKHATLMGTLTIDGKQFTPANLTKILQARIAAVQGVDAARGPFKAALLAQKAELADTHDLLVAVKQGLQLMFRTQVDVLGDFGLTPRKRGKPTPETHVKAAEKARATREARGTKGKKEKLAIHGVVPETTPGNPPAPPPAPAAPAPKQP